MPIPEEVDSLQRQISLIESEIRDRKKKIVQLDNDIEAKDQQVTRCRIHREMCREHLQKIRKLDVIPLKDFKEMTELFEKNIDLVTTNQNLLAKARRERQAHQEALPYLESMLHDCKSRLKKWNVVIAFPKK